MVATTWVLFFGETGWLRVRAEQRAVESLRQESAEVQGAIENLQARVEEIQRPASPLLEKVARERYLMKREGEEVIHILDPTVEETEAETEN